MSPTDNDKEAAAKKVAQAKALLVKANQKREETRAKADQVFWKTVQNEIEAGHLRQADAVDALGYTREYIRKQIKALPAEDS